MKIASKSRKRVVEELPSMKVTGEDLERIDGILNKYGRKRSSLMNVLHDLQNEYYYLPTELLEIVSRELGVSFNQVFGIATFFSAFFMKPLGKYRVKVCEGMTCYNENATKIIESLENYLKIKKGETREDGKFTLLGVHCLGCCSMAPAVQINEDVYGELNPEKALEIVGDIEESASKEVEITDELIQNTIDYIRGKEGKVRPKKAAEDLGLTEEQFDNLIDEMKDRGIIGARANKISEKGR